MSLRLCCCSQNVYNRGVNRAEISGPARKFFFGPARNQCIIKFVLYNFFEILQKNQYNYIKLHSHFPLVQILYCPSTTVMYNVQLYQQRLKNFGSRGGTSDKISYMNSIQVVLYCNGIAKILVRGTFSKNVFINNFFKILQIL